MGWGRYPSAQGRSAGPQSSDTGVRLPPFSCGGEKKNTMPAVLQRLQTRKLPPTCAAEDVGMVFLRGSASPRRGGAHRPKPPHRPPNWVTTHALSRTRLPPLPTPRPSEGRTYAHWSA